MLHRSQNQLHRLHSRRHRLNQSHDISSQPPLPSLYKRRPNKNVLESLEKIKSKQ